jgi:hypothetical protein
MKSPSCLSCTCATPTPLTTPRPPAGSFVHFTEVMVNRPDDVYVERKGRIERLRQYVPSESVEHCSMRPVLEPSGRGTVPNPLTQVWAASIERERARR